MIDLGSLEINLHKANLTQFALVCFFSPYLVYAGTISYLINIFGIWLTTKVYTQVTRRPISRRAKDMGIWNDLYSTIGYLGFLYNAAIIVRKSNTVGEIFNHNKDTERDQTVLMSYNIITIILILKFIIEKLIPKLPRWMNVKITREKLTKERIRKRNDMILNRLGMKEDGEIDETLFEDKEAQSLRYFFKNKTNIEKYEGLKVNKNELEGNDEDTVSFKPNIQLEG